MGGSEAEDDNEGRTDLSALQPVALTRALLARKQAPRLSLMVEVENFILFEESLKSVWFCLTGIEDAGRLESGTYPSGCTKGELLC